MDKASSLIVVAIACVVFLFSTFQMSNIYSKHGLIHLRDFYPKTVYVTPQDVTANFIDRNLSRKITGDLQYSDLAYGGFFVMFMFSFPITVIALFKLIKKAKPAKS